MVTPTHDASPEVLAAVDRWAKSVFGAPRRLASLVTRIDRQDEVLHRIYTEFVRRDLQTERAPAAERRPSAPAVDPARIDPFVHNLESLRAASTCVVGCIGCHASGRVACQACTGSGRARCHGCRGAGRVLNPATNRQNKCKVCKATGTVACSACAEGMVSCATCLGSGHQKIWLSFSEGRQTRVTVMPDSPTAVAHPQLRAARWLDPSEVAAFSLHVNMTSPGPLPQDELDGAARAAVQKESARVDPRFERVVQQQYMQLAVPLQAVTYRMCGADGHVVLSGRNLTGAHTPEARLPIRRRLILWPILVVLIAVFATPLATATVAGKSAYFGAATGVAALCGVIALFASVPLIGGLLRCVGSGPGLRGLRVLERIAAGIWIAALIATLIAGAVVRPGVAEFDEAMAAGQFGRAHVVLNALREVEGGPDGTLEREDRLLLAEADASSGVERLKKLDEVAGRGHSHAAEAATAARRERIAAIATLVQERRGDEAIAAIDASFADGWRGDAELAELRAAGHDLQAELCSDDACRLAAAKTASAAHGTAARVARVDETRERIVAELLARPAESEPHKQVHAVSGVSALAEHTLVQVTGEPEVTAAAIATRTWADQERSKVALVGADAATIGALFPDLERSARGHGAALFEQTEVYFNMSAQGVCTGVYAVGPAAKQRVVPTATGDRLVARAVGQDAGVPVQAKAEAAVSSAKVAGVKVVARWRGEQLVELRIGDAAP